MRVIIAGGSGYIGRRLADTLKEDYEVVILSRNPQKHPMPDAQVVGWDGKTAQGWGELADGAFAIVNLAGENIGAKLWSAAHKAACLNSRLDAGKAVVEAVRSAGVKPKVLVQASAVGYYGNAPQPVDEQTAPGNDFLADVCKKWEAATAEVESLGVRRVVTRTGIVIDPAEGALARMIIPFKLFAGGPLGSGKQPFPWIHPADEMGAMRFLMENENAHGAFNLAAPNVLTNAEFGRALGKVMGRPAFMPAPGFALKLVLGEMSVVVLEGQNTKADKLLAAGYNFKFPEAEGALQDLIK